MPSPSPNAIAPICRRASPSQRRSRRSSVPRLPSHVPARRSARAQSERYSEWDGALSAGALEAVAALLGSDRTYSPTSLEGYAVCPQQFLMGDLLRIRAVEEPERTFEIDALRRGNLFHRIFERFHSEWRGRRARRAGAGRCRSDAGARRGGVRCRRAAWRDRLPGVVGGHPPGGHRRLPAVARAGARGPADPGAAQRGL